MSSLTELFPKRGALSRPTEASAEGEPGPSAKCPPQASLRLNFSHKALRNFFTLDPGFPSISGLWPFVAGLRESGRVTRDLHLREKV
jgi:hypothetical protein